ncbi:hypothetical protein [Leisingera sp. ANG-M1]|uniref:hypothetical protein n=1 Tax=Leisingera sp. ANG-M1 TaxID=1577895 RepID=UPI000ABF3331|nr:hypothetical protein [Leisingera sp. ANG-M1]
MRAIFLVVPALLIAAAVFFIYPSRDEVRSILVGVSELDRRHESMTRSYAAYVKMNDPNLVVQVDRETFQDFLVPYISSELRKIRLPEGGDLEFKDPNFTFVEQGIISEVSFSVASDEYQVSLSGTLNLMVTPYVKEGSVFVIPAVVGGEVSAGRQWPWRSKFAKGLVNAVVKEFEDQINATHYLNPVEVKVDLRDIKLLKMDDLSPDNDLKVSEGLSSMSFHIEHAAVLIAPEGLQIMAHIDDDGVVNYLSEDVKLDVPAPESDFESDFENYRLSFLETRENYFPGFGSSSGASVSREFIARKMNKAFSSVDGSIFEFGKTIHDVTENFSAHPMIYKKSHVHCGSVKQDCEAKRKSCQSTRSCANTSSCAGRSCARDCSKFDLFCKAKAEACRNEERIKSEACRVAARVKAETCRNEERVKAELCRAGQDLEVKNCKLNNETKVAACKTELEILRVVEDFLDIGEIDGTVKVSNISASAQVDEIIFDSKLQEAVIVSDIGVDGFINVDINLNPEGIGHLACLWKEKPSISSHISAKHSGYEMSSRIEFSKGDSEGVLIGRVNVVGEPIRVEIEPSPWESLTQDTGFALSCSVADVLLKAASILDLIDIVNLPEEVRGLMIGSYTHSDVSFDFDFSLGRMDFTVGDTSIGFFPSVDEQAINFLSSEYAN